MAALMTHTVNPSHYKCLSIKLAALLACTNDRGGSESFPRVRAFLIPRIPRTVQTRVNTLRSTASLSDNPCDASVVITAVNAKGGGIYQPE